MEAVIVIAVIAVMTPFIILAFNSGHLMRSLADFISGKRAGARELKEVYERVHALEAELDELKGRLLTMEESQEFSTRLLEGMKSESPGPEAEASMESEPEH